MEEGGRGGGRRNEKPFPQLGPPARIADGLQKFAEPRDPRGPPAAVATNERYAPPMRTGRLSPKCVRNSFALVRRALTSAPLSQTFLASLGNTVRQLPLIYKQLQLLTRAAGATPIRSNRGDGATADSPRLYKSNDSGGEAGSRGAHPIRGAAGQRGARNRPPRNWETCRAGG